MMSFMASGPGFIRKALLDRTVAAVMYGLPAQYLQASVSFSGDIVLIATLEEARLRFWTRVMFLRSQR